jgi:indole-3-glycerol phosphate synthase
MNILNEIIAQRRKTVAELKKTVSTKQLEQKPGFNKICLPLTKSLLSKNNLGIIAEFKKASPSKGNINIHATVEQVTSGYQAGGAAAVSILTEPFYFKGADAYIEVVYNNLNIPILRKDFITDEYQILEAKAIGADVILLIAACLTQTQTKALAAFAKSLGLQVLLELHEEKELDCFNEFTDVVGINNRNLKTFEVDIENSIRMAGRLPATTLRIAESGIYSIDDILYFKQNGFNGYLIGENFMKEPEPGKAFINFNTQLIKANEG